MFHFKWNEERVWQLVAAVRLKQGKLLSAVSSLALDDRAQTVNEILIEEVAKTAQIEGERYSLEHIRSSVHKKFGLESAGLPAPLRHVDGLVEVLLDATTRAAKPLDKERLCRWHKALFPTGQSGLRTIVVGKYRNSEMEVVSGAIGRERVHYRAPDPAKLPQLMKSFFAWWQVSNTTTDGLIRAGIAHVYFVLIHPFDDGNGRIARALTDMAIAQDDGAKYRYYSMSTELMKRRAEYYRVLEQVSKGNEDITDWLLWFLHQFEASLDFAVQKLDRYQQKTLFWQRYRGIVLNVRQLKVINRLLDAGKDGFVGAMSTRKYVQMTGASRATAYRELSDLTDKGMLVVSGFGRGVKYEVRWETIT